MGKKYRNLFDQITTDDNLYDAYYKAAKGCKYSNAHLVFQQHLGTNLEYLKQNIEGRTYIQGIPIHFKVFEPKLRLITAIPFIDRVAEHAINNLIDPIFDSVFLPQSYACRKGKGTQAAARFVQSKLRFYHKTQLDKTVYVLKTDFSKYFNNIRIQKLLTEFDRKISCAATRDLYNRMIQNPDDCGLPTGKLMSQLSANIYGHVVDRFLVHTLGITDFVRYMDDIVIFDTDYERLHEIKNYIQDFCRKELNLGFSKWSIQPADRGINFVGYRIWHNKKLLRKQFVLSMKRKIREYETFNDDKSLREYIGSIKGHCIFANSFNLIECMGLAPYQDTNIEIFV